MIILKTERLILRNIELKDAVEMKDYRNNAICSKYQRGQTKDMDGIKALIKKYQFETLSADKPFIMAVALKATDEMIGEIVVLPNKGTFSLGYTISYKHHRMGDAFKSPSANPHFLGLSMNFRRRWQHFAIKRNVPNNETVAALEEYYDMKANPENYKRYDSFSDARNEALNA